MVRFAPTSAGNDLQLQSEIRRQAGALLGPNSVGPGQGHIRFYDADGDTFHIEPGGPLVKHKGGMTGLIPLLEGHADRLTAYGEAITSLGARTAQNETDIAAHGERLTAYGTAITGLGTRVGQAESDIGAQATRLTNYGNAITGLGTRMGAAEGDINTLQATKAAVSYVDSVSSRTSTAQARADAAHSNAQTAHDRADAAFARAGVAIVDAANADSRAQSAQSNVARIAAWIRDAVVKDPSGLPPWNGLG